MTDQEPKTCNHNPLKMCDPCCVCSRLEVKTLRAENKKLKQAAENEFQEKEAISYNKRWFQEQFVKKDDRIRKLKETIAQGLLMFGIFLPDYQSHLTIKKMKEALSQEEPK